MDIVFSQSSVQSHVSVVLECGKVLRFDDTCMLRGPAKRMLIGGHQGAENKAFLIFWQGGQDQFVGDLLTTSLYGKIGLTEGDNGLIGISVLYDKVACVARKTVIFDLALAPRAEFDHFVGFNKMVRDSTACFLLASDIKKSLPIWYILDHLLTTRL